MSPAAMPRRICARWSGALACAALLQATAFAGPLPGAAGLQLSTELTPPRAAATERALLRVEYRAAKSRDAENDIVGDILSRVRRMEIMVADVRQLMAAWPAPAPTPVAAPAQPAARPAATTGATVDITPSELYSLIALAAAVTFLVWLLKERHAYLKARRQRAATLGAHPVKAEPAPPAKPTPPAARAQTAAAPPPKAAAATASYALERPTAPNPDDAVKLADIMLSMGLTHGAAQTLSEQVHGHPRQALFHWFKLLEIYRRSAMREDFEQAAAELRRYFNVQAQAWHAGDGAISIEDYPHLAAQLQALWPGEECAAFLAHLLEDNRGGTRTGFPQSVAEEILLLQRMLAAEEQELALA